MSYAGRDAGDDCGVRMRVRIAGAAGGGYAPRMRPGHLMSAFVCTALLLLLAWPAYDADSPPRRIDYRADRLSVQVTQVSLTEVLEEIARQARAEIIGGVKEEKPITVEFTGLPLDEGLGRLLGKQNFVLVYGKVGLRAVELLGGPQAPPKVATTPPPTTLSGMPNVFQMFQTRPPCPINGRLGAALASDKATYPQLLDSAMHHEDVAVRSDAIRTWLQCLEDDAELRGAFVTAISAVDDQQLATSLRGMAGARAEELLQQITTLARASELRLKASQVFLQLKKVPPGGA
jgi:hypothetical protein